MLPVFAVTCLIDADGRQRHGGPVPFAGLQSVFATLHTGPHALPGRRFWMTRITHPAAVANCPGITSARCLCGALRVS